MESARPAVDADVEQLAVLARRARTELGARRGGDLWAAREARAEPLADALRGLLARDDASVVVGAIDHVVVGLGAVEVERLGDGRRLGVVTDLYVEPEARGIGVGEAMTDLLATFCESRGCTGLDATALPGDRATKNFFEEQGFRARMLVMHRALGPPDAPRPS